MPLYGKIRLLQTTTQTTDHVKLFTSKVKKKYIEKLKNLYTICCHDMQCNFFLHKRHMSYALQSNGWIMPREFSLLEKVTKILGLMNQLLSLLITWYCCQPTETCSISRAP